MANMAAEEEYRKGEKFRGHEASIPGFELKAFEALEREFQEVLQELLGDPSLDRFRVEYEKLHRALKKSHESEKRLVRKCRELNTEILTNATKVQNALKLNEEDQNTITVLKKEIDKAWKLVDASQEKEAKAKDNIQQLKLEIANLSQIIEQGCGISTAQENELGDVVRMRDKLVKERDQQLEQILQLTKVNTELIERSRVSEELKVKLEYEIALLKEQLAAKHADSEREARKRGRMEKEIKELKGTLEARQNDIQKKIAEGTSYQEQISTLEATVQEQKLLVEQNKKEFDALNQKVMKLDVDLQEQIHTNTLLLAENSQRQVEVNVREQEIQSLKAEIMRVQKLREAIMAKLKAEEKAVEEAQKQKDKLHTDILHLEKDLEHQRKLTEHERKRQEDLLRERDVLNKLKTQAENSVEMQSDLVKINEVAIHNLEIEIQNYRSGAVKQEKLIQQLEKDRQRCNNEATQAGIKYMQALDDVKFRDGLVNELQKKIFDAENKLKVQQNMYETARSEKLLYSKTLLEAQDQINELQRRIKIMNHEIEKLREDLISKDSALIKEHSELLKVEKEREGLKKEVGDVNQEVKELKAVIETHLSTIENLNYVTAEADEEIFRLKKVVDVTKSERDILATQIMRRDDELRLVYEKIKIQHSAILKGHIQYKSRLNELRILKIKLADIKREHGVLQGSVKNIQILRREIHNLNRELLQEQNKVTALSEELENPLNVHRWRQLEGRDPTAYEMILKIQTLQKRLILKTEQVVEKDLVIQDKEKLYMELRSILARQPGPELTERLAVYSKSLKEKTRRMKAMAAELSMHQQQAIEFKSEIQILKSDLDEMKKKYYEQKKEDYNEREKKFKDYDASYCPNKSQTKFVGGGYAVP